MKRYSNIFKIFSEEKRLKLFLMLLKAPGDYYVCEIADALKETHYNVSKYLKELKYENLVNEKRIGKGVLYSINEDVDYFLKNLYSTLLTIPDEYVINHINLLKLRVSLRENNKCVIGVNHPKWRELITKIEDKEIKEQKIKTGG